MDREQRAENKAEQSKIKIKIKSKSKPNGTALALLFILTQTNLIRPNPQCISGKNRRPGDRAKPDFDGLLRVGAWGRASGSRVEAHSTHALPQTDDMAQKIHKQF